MPHSGVGGRRGPGAGGAPLPFTSGANGDGLDRQGQWAGSAPGQVGDPQSEQAASATWLQGGGGHTAGAGHKTRGRGYSPDRQSEAGTADRHRRSGNCRPYK